MDCSKEGTHAKMEYWAPTTHSLPGKNMKYILQAKHQIGSYYFESLALHKTARAYSAIRIYSRPCIPVAFPPPAGDFTVLAGDWFKPNHCILRRLLDMWKTLPRPDGLLIN
ncbi:unnamed protein product [Rhodiola kirilowii]